MADYYALPQEYIVNLLTMTCMSVSMSVCGGVGYSSSSSSNTNDELLVARCKVRDCHSGDDENKIKY